MALEREMETFRRELPRLLQNQTNRGKYVLIQGDRVDSIWESTEGGLDAGYERFGLGPFLVKEITDQEKVYYFSRSVKTCHS